MLKGEKKVRLRDLSNEELVERYQGVTRAIWHFEFRPKPSEFPSKASYLQSEVWLRRELLRRLNGGQ